MRAPEQGGTAEGTALRTALASLNSFLSLNSFPLEFRVSNTPGAHAEPRRSEPRQVVACWRDGTREAIEMLQILTNCKQFNSFSSSVSFITRQVGLGRARARKGPAAAGETGPFLGSRANVHRPL